MNIENFQKVRDNVAANAQFRMSSIQHTCGSVACVMGSALIVMGCTLPRGHDLNILLADRSKMSDWTQEICDWLDITCSQFDYIYMGGWSENANELDMIEQAEAVGYLDECISAGKVILR
jgi:hypothetical protein